MEKIKKIDYFLIGIIIFGIIIRFINLNKDGGLWYDEIVSYNEAKLSNIISIISYTFKTDVHFPLYQIVLHYWGNLFSFSDTSLRTFSAVCGVGGVVLLFFAGKELNSVRNGLFCAVLCALSSFMIFYSQEVRLYSFLMLLSSTVLLFLIKTKNNPSKFSNYLGLLFSSILLMYTNTIAFVFVYIQLFLFIIFQLLTNSDNKTIMKNNFKMVITFIVLSIPFFLIMLLKKNSYIEDFNGYHFDLSSIIVIVQDWFSPVLEGLFDNPYNYFHIINKLNLHNLFFIFLPIFVSIFCIVQAIRKDKFAIILFSSSIIFVIIEILAVYCTNFKLLARYTSIVLPNIIFLVGYGLYVINNKKIKYLLLFSIITINIIYLISMPNAPYKLNRNGVNNVVQLIDPYVNDNDFIVVWNRKGMFTKYFNKKVNELSLLKNVAYTSEVMLNNEAELNKMSAAKKKMVLRYYFYQSQIPQNTVYLINQIYNHETKGQKFIIITTKNFDSFTQEGFSKTILNNYEYDKMSLNDLLTIRAILNLKTLCAKKFKFVKKLQKAQYVVIIFEK